MAGQKRGRYSRSMDENIVPKNKRGKINVKICGIENGLEEYEGVHFVRVVSKGYNLLIMDDYMPMIGEIKGSVYFRTNKAEYRRDHITGYFMHKHNEFSLMLKDEGLKTENKET